MICLGILGNFIQSKSDKLVLYISCISFLLLIKLSTFFSCSIPIAAWISFVIDLLPAVDTSNFHHFLSIVLLNPLDVSKPK